MHQAELNINKLLLTKNFFSSLSVLTLKLYGPFWPTIKRLLNCNIVPSIPQQLNVIKYYYLTTEWWHIPSHNPLESVSKLIILPLVELGIKTISKYVMLL